MRTFRRPFSLVSRVSPASLLSLGLLTVATLSFVACGGDDEAPPSAATPGGDAGAAGTSAKAGAAGASAGKAGAAGTSGASGGSAGQSGAGGGAGALGGGAGGSAGSPGVGGASGGGATAGSAGSAGNAGASTGGGGAAGASGGTGGAAGQGGGSAKKPFDWVGVIGTGQSLSVGAQGQPVISTKQPYGNLKLADSSADPKFPIDGTGTYATAPLVEPIRAKMGGYATSEYPNNIAGETPHSGMGNQLSAFFQTRGLGEYVTAHSVVGWSGKPLVCIDKDESPASKCADTPVTTRGYLGGLAEAKAFAKLAKAANKTFGYGAVILTHGESDAGNQKYQAGIIQLQADYEKDLQAITGQTSRIPLLVTQTSTKPGATSSAVQVWKAGIEAEGKVICVGPKYAYEYAADVLRLPAASYLRLGQKYAEVMDLVVNQGVAWEPLAPSRDVAPTVAGAVITVPFHVPNPPLQWDDSQPKNHQKENDEWAKGRGFEVRTNKGAPLTIAGVEIVGSAVKITLAKAPVAADGLVVGYALTQDGAGNQGGLATGLRGDLRDADDYLGYDTQTISAKLTKGSATVKSAQANGFATRAGRDLVTGKGVAAGTVVLTTPDANTITLSKPWTGETATVDLTLHHDQHNYAVHFSLPVPP